MSPLAVDFQKFCRNFPRTVLQSFIFVAIGSHAGAVLSSEIPPELAGLFSKIEQLRGNAADADPPKSVAAPIASDTRSQPAKPLVSTIDNFGLQRPIRECLPKIKPDDTNVPDVTYRRSVCAKLYSAEVANSPADHEAPQYEYPDNCIVTSSNWRFQIIQNSRSPTPKKNVDPWLLEQIYKGRLAMVPASEKNKDAWLLEQEVMKKCSASISGQDIASHKEAYQKGRLIIEDPYEKDLAVREEAYKKEGLIREKEALEMERASREVAEKLSKTNRNFEIKGLSLKSTKQQILDIGRSGSKTIWHCAPDKLFAGWESCEVSFVRKKCELVGLVNPLYGHIRNEERCQTYFDDIAKMPPSVRNVYTLVGQQVEWIKVSFYDGKVISLAFEVTSMDSVFPETFIAKYGPANETLVKREFGEFDRYVWQDLGATMLMDRKLKNITINSKPLFALRDQRIKAAEAAKQAADNAAMAAERAKRQREAERRKYDL